MSKESKKKHQLTPIVNASTSPSEAKLQTAVETLRGIQQLMAQPNESSSPSGQILSSNENTSALAASVEEDPVPGSVFFDMLKCFSILKGLTDKQKLWTSSGQFNLQISQDSLKDSCWRNLCGQNRFRNLQDLGWLFGMTKKKLDYEMNIYERNQNYLLKNNISRLFDKLVTQAKQNTNHSNSFLPEPLSYAEVVAKSQPRLLPADAPLNRKTMIDITDNIANIDKIIEGLMGSKKGLDMLKENADYKTSPEIQANLTTIQGEIQSILDSVKINMEVFKQWKALS